jgi:hypothetical protein
MRKQRAVVAVLLATISLTLMIPLPTSLARGRKPASEPAREVAAPPTPEWEIELTALRQQVEEQQQIIDTLRRQVEEKQGAVETLTVRLDARRSVEDALLRQLEDLRQEGARQSHLLYGAIGAMIVTLGLLFGLRGWVPNYRTRNRRLARVPQNWSATP